MDNLARKLDISLPPGKSTFLWGPRKTGKSTYLRTHFPESLYYDFLDTDLFFAFSKQPSLLRKQLLACSEEELSYPIILDEVQKIPQILDEIQLLIETKKLQFILCGSSARKLKQGRANMLGGRAWRYELFPFTWSEIDRFDLTRAISHGLIPIHYLEEAYEPSLQAYIQDYLKEEVFNEGLIRNIPAFSRFFDAVGYSHGEMINFSNIARDCGVSSRTVKEYYHILSDTLLGRFVEPFKKRQGRNVIIKAPKFYLFDVGIAGYMRNRLVNDPRSESFGKALEHFIFMEVCAYRAYARKDFPIHYWRTKSGLEVDFILDNGAVALEVKGGARVDKRDFLPLNAFIEEHKPRAAYMVVADGRPWLAGDVLVLSWNDFLTKLWQGEIL